MTIQLFSMLAAAALTVTGSGTASETRSAQSLPAQNLVLAPVPAGSAGKLHPTSHLADAASDPTDQGNCERSAGHWDRKRLRCRRGGWWYGSSGAQLLIGGGTIAGIIYALTETGSRSGPGQSVSN